MDTMDTQLNFEVRGFLCGAAMLGLLSIGGTVAAQASCAKTPVGAVRAAAQGTLVSPAPGDNGYRVASVRWDPVLKQRWASIVVCKHPEWPAFTLSAGSPGPASPQQVSQAAAEDHENLAVVHAGDVVHLWRNEDMMRIEVTGVAEQSGSMGSAVRVRLLRRNTDDQSIEEQFNGIVRGPANVEMQP